MAHAPMCLIDSPSSCLLCLPVIYCSSLGDGGYSRSRACGIHVGSQGACFKLLMMVHETSGSSVFRGLHRLLRLEATEQRKHQDLRIDPPSVNWTAPHIERRYLKFRMGTCWLKSKQCRLNHLGLRLSHQVNFGASPSVDD